MRKKFLNGKFLASLAGLLIMASTVFALNVGPSTANAAIDNTPDCDNVAIIKCGAFSESELRSEYDKNTYGDLHRVYSAFGISRSDLSGFENGVVYRNGDVKIGDKVVATNAMTAGRNYGGTPIANTKNVGKYSVSKFVDEGQTAFIKMVNGKFSFAIVKACGNPVTGTPKTPPKPKPTYSCDSLTAKKISRTEFEFTATGAAANGAKVTGYRFTFGDGKSTTSTSRTVPHTYSKEGSYTVEVEIRVEVDGSTKYVSGGNCDVTIKVTPPPAKPEYACDSLSARITNKENRTIKYTLRYTAEGGASLKSVDFNFGDGSTRQGVTPSQLSDVEHSYARDGSFTTTATLHFNVAKEVKDVKCSVKITISPEVCPENPTLPKDSPDCGVIEVCELSSKQIIKIKESEFDASKHSKDDADCQETPEVLPSTGPESFVMGGLGLGSLTAAGYYLRSSRRNLINKLLNR